MGIEQKYFKVEFQPQIFIWQLIRLMQDTCMKNVGRYCQEALIKA